MSSQTTESQVAALKQEIHELTELNGPGASRRIANLEQSNARHREQIALMEAEIDRRKAEILANDSLIMLAQDRDAVCDAIESREAKLDKLRTALQAQQKHEQLQILINKARKLQELLK